MFNPLITTNLSPNFMIAFLIILVWSLFWKGFALWHAAQNRDFKWFIPILIINSIGILEIIYLLVIKKMKFNFVTKRFEESKSELVDIKEVLEEESGEQK